MNRRELLHPCGLLVVSLLLSGCGTSPLESARRDIDTPLDKAIDADALVASRTKHVGDNSKVGAVLDALHLEVIGTRTFEIQSATEPYGVHVAFNSVLNRTMDDKVGPAMKRRAALALTQIDNAGYISWRIPTEPNVNGKLTRAEAEKLAGGPLEAFDTADEITGLAKKL